MDVQLDVSRGGYAGRLEVIEGPSGRKWRSEEERARIATESLMPGVRVADVARRHGVTRWQAYDWRKRLRDGRLRLPEDVASTPAFAALVVEEPPQATPAQGASIEIVLGEVVIRAGGMPRRRIWRGCSARCGRRDDRAGRAPAGLCGDAPGGLPQGA